MQVSPLIKNTSATVSDQRLDSGKVWERGCYCLLSERLLPVSAGNWTLGLQFWQWLGQAYYQGSKCHTLYLHLVSFPDPQYGGCACTALRIWERD